VGRGRLMVDVADGRIERAIILSTASQRMLNKIRHKT
jgi:hypothetical protein